MADEQTPTNQRVPLPQVLIGLAVLGAAAYGLYNYAGYLQREPSENAQALTFLIMVGLALIIALMAGLGVVYSMLGLADPRQALALPEGSIRGLIAFSLLLIFVCLATFVYKGAEQTQQIEVGRITKATAQQIAALEKTFTVAAEPARNADGTRLTDTAVDGAPIPLFNATYFSERGAQANEIGKQIFTTLATVFVSVVSFYFGSSTTASAVGAGIRAAGAPPNSPPGDGAKGQPETVKRDQSDPPS